MSSDRGEDLFGEQPRVCATWYSAERSVEEEESLDGWRIFAQICTPSTSHLISVLFASQRVLWCSMSIEDPLRGSITTLLKEIGTALFVFFARLSPKKEKYTTSYIHEMRQYFGQQGSIVATGSTCLTIISMLMQDVSSFLSVLHGCSRTTKASATAPVSTQKPQSLEERLQQCTTDEQKAAVLLHDVPPLQQGLALLMSNNAFMEYISLHDIIDIACTDTLQWEQQLTFNVETLPKQIDTVLPPLTRLIESLQLPQILSPNTGHVSQKIVDLSAGQTILCADIQYDTRLLNSTFLSSLLLQVVKVYMYTDRFVHIPMSVLEAVQQATFQPCKENVYCSSQCVPWMLKKTSTITNASFLPTKVMLGILQGDMSINQNEMPASFHVLACKVSNCDNIAYHSVNRDDNYFTHADIRSIPHEHRPNYHLSPYCAVHLYKLSEQIPPAPEQRYISNPTIFNQLNGIEWSTTQTQAPWNTSYKVYQTCLHVVQTTQRAIAATEQKVAKQSLSILCLQRIGSPLWVELVHSMSLIQEYLTCIISAYDEQIFTYQHLSEYTSRHVDIQLPSLTELERLPLSKQRLLQKYPVFCLRLSGAFFMYQSNSSSSTSVCFPYDTMQKAHTQVMQQPLEVQLPLGRYLQARVKSGYQLNHADIIYTELSRQKLSSSVQERQNTFLAENCAFIDTALHSKCNRSYLEKVNALRQQDQAKWTDYIIQSAGDYMEKQEKEQQKSNPINKRSVPPKKVNRAIYKDIDTVDDTVEDVHIHDKNDSNSNHNNNNTKSNKLHDNHNIRFIRVRRELNEDELQTVHKEALRLKEEAIVRNTQPVFTFAYGSIEVSVQESKFDEELEWNSEDEEEMDIYTRQVDSLCVLLQGKEASVQEWSKTPQHLELTELHDLTPSHKQTVISAVQKYCIEQDTMERKKQEVLLQKKQVPTPITIETLEDDNTEEILARGADGITVSSRDLPLDLQRQILDQEQEEGPPEALSMANSHEI